MKQAIITTISVLVIIGLLSVIILGSRNKTPILFYGNTCLYCKDVEDWMEENKIEEKITVVRKEVYDNRQNALELERAAKSCGLPTDSIAVPFLYTPEGTCLISTPDIAGYLGSKAGLSDENQATESGEENDL